MGKPRLTVEPFDPDLKRQFKALAASLDLSMSQAAQLAVGRWVRSYEDGPDEEDPPNLLPAR